MGQRRYGNADRVIGPTRPIFAGVVLSVALMSALAFLGAEAQQVRNPFARPQAARDTLNAYTGLFKSREIFSDNMKSFTKWSDVWQRQTLPRRSSPVVLPDDLNRCASELRQFCNRAQWEAFIETQAAAGPMTPEILSKVNRFMNRAPYIVDPINWNLPDYWATPDEFMLKDGDCEDYAITKYVTLKRLGYAPSKMRVVVLQDENLRVAHAVLAVELGDETYILDNQADPAVPHGKILHYRPVYSINESGWWLHQRPRSPRRARQ